MAIPSGLIAFVSCRTTFTVSNRPIMIVRDAVMRAAETCSRPVVAHLSNGCHENATAGFERYIVRCHCLVITSHATTRDRSTPSTYMF